MMDVSDKKSMLKRVAKNGLNLANVTSDLQDDLDMVLTAVKNNHKAIIFSRKWFPLVKDEKDIVAALQAYADSQKLNIEIGEDERMKVKKIKL